MPQPQPHLRQFVLVSFDDILVYNKSWEEHIGRVLGTLMQHKWVTNRKKCEFGRMHIKYLRHRISEKGVKKDQEKVEAILE